MRVLVVEESAGQGEAVRTALRLAGHAVATTLAPPAALLETLDELQPDLVVMPAAALKAIVDALALANRRLEERKLVERAKGLLMKSRGMDEEAAYTLLRKTAMDRNLRLGEVAQRVIDASDLLGA